MAQATAELDRAGLAITPIAEWETTRIGPFLVTALPAVDGTGESQLSWAVEADGHRIIHCGDTLFHGSWWKAAKIAGPFNVAFLPINGAVVNFPWRQPPSPLPAAMTPDQAAVAANLLRADVAVPIHFGGFDLEPFYVSEAEAVPKFLTATKKLGVQVIRVSVGTTTSV